MDILDIHTHRLPLRAGQAIRSVEPAEFAPQHGQYYSVGFHPWHLSEEGSTDDWRTLGEMICHPQVLAVGETGLDKVTGVPYALQEAAFKRQIDMAAAVRKPLIIHCVHSYNEIMALKKSTKTDIPWVIHGFRGKKELARQLTDHGIYLSYGFIYQEEAMRETPLEMLFLETDESAADIRSLYHLVADQRSLPVNSLTERVQENIYRVFFRE